MDKVLKLLEIEKRSGISIAGAVTINFVAQTDPRNTIEGEVVGDGDASPNDEPKP